MGTTGSAERGAVLVHVALCLLVLCAFSAFAIDWGVFWVSRGQAQNAADAGAMAGAVALAYDDLNNHADNGPAKRSAFIAAESSRVWGQVANVNVGTDITFPTCPDGSTSCVRVDVYRNQSRGNPLPVFFGSLIGLDHQDVRATATAEATEANATSCLKPWAIPDKWEEHYPTPGAWNPLTSSFDTMTSGKNPVPLANPDVYRPPTESDMTGFRASGTPNDIGTLVVLKSGKHGEGLSQPGWLYPVRLKPTDSGGADYSRNIRECTGSPIKIGDTLHPENGVKNGPTDQAVTDLIAADPSATWSDPDGPGGVPGKVVNSCMQTASCPTSVSPSPTQSPRIVAVALFNPATFVDGGDIQVVNILGFFIVAQDSKDKSVQGYLTTYPGLTSADGGTVVDQAAFSHVVTLVR
jgi:hypothetical protein